MTDTDQTEPEQDDVTEQAREFLAGILDRMDIDAEIEVAEEDDKIVLDIQCHDTERVIGRRGQVVDALQHLVGKVSYRDRTKTRGKPIIVDADGYRARQIERLRAFAVRMSEKAVDTGEVVELNPMTAHDRRIVHLTLADLEGVSTRSEGEGEDRRVLIVPASHAE